MRYLYIAVCAAFFSFMSPSAFSCGMHGGFGGFGTNWSPYSPDTDSYGSDDYSTSSDDYDADEQETEAAETVKKARPVFSNSAARASELAKNKVADESADSESVKNAPQN